MPSPSKKNREKRKRKKKKALLVCANRDGVGGEKVITIYDA
jgi:hypothetical protein